MDKLPESWLPATFYARTQTDLYAEFKNRYLILLSLVSNIENMKDYDKIQGEFIKKSKALDLDSIQINKNTPKVMKALKDSGLFLQYRCGLKTINDLSYKLMIVPVSYILMKKDRMDIDTKQILNILEVWYWFSIFSGTYRDNMNKRCLLDIELLYKTIIEKNYDLFEKEFLNKYKDRFFNFEDYSDKFTLINNNDVPSSIKNSLKQYMLSKCPKDFINEETRLNSWNTDFKIEYHHIIPLGSDLNSTISESNKRLRNNKNHILNSPINLAPILKSSNNKISNKPIERYIKALSGLAVEQHFIPETLLNQVEQRYDSGNFYKKFLEERLKKIKVNLQNELIYLLSNTNINY